VAAIVMLALTSLVPAIHRSAEAQSVTAPPVSVAYVDVGHPPANGQFPSPWFGSPNVVFVGTSANWDGGGVRVDNTTGADMPNVQVTLDVSDGVTSTHWNLWTPVTIPAGQSLIVAETSFQNFDMSDEPPNPPSPFQASGVYPAADCTPDSAIPVVHVTIGATTFDYFDTTKVLTRGGFDLSHCPAGTDETASWHSISTSSAPPTSTPTATPTVVPNPAATATPTLTPTPTNTVGAFGAGEWAVGFAEGSQNSGTWSVPAPYQFAVNWNGSPGARPEAIVYSSVTPGVTITGPTVTNASTESASGGSLLLLQGSGLLLRGSTPGHHTSGVSGGTSATIPAPAGLAAGDLVLVYIDTPNTMTPPTGWTQQRQDGQGTVWSQTFASVPANLGTWSTTGGSGWDYTAAAFGASGGSPTIVGVGGGGAQTSSAVNTGSATPGGVPASTSTPTPTATPTATPTFTPNPVAATSTPTPTATPTNTPAPTGAGTVEWAVGLAEAGQNSGTWSVPAPFQFAVNWNGSPGARPEAIVFASVTPGVTITGPTVTNAGSQNNSGGSLLLLQGSGLLLRGSTPGHHTSGVSGGTSATIPAPAGLAAGDLVLVYIDTPNTMTPPPGWTQQRHDGQGTVWSQTFTSVPPNLGTWSTTGGSGWDYTAAAFGASSGSPAIVATGGGGAQTTSAVATGSATPP
jgi:hypothetical protein